MKMCRLMGVVALGIGVVSLLRGSTEPGQAPANLIQNPDFSDSSRNSSPAHYTLTGSARYQFLGDVGHDMSSVGVALNSGGEAASISQTVSHLKHQAGAGYRFSIYALPQETFSVRNDALYLKVEFLGVDGVRSYDAKTKSIYPLIEQARRDLTANGVHHLEGAAAWTTYTLDFVVPFAEVDQLRLSVCFENGNGSGAFLISKFNLTPQAAAPSTRNSTTANTGVDSSHLIPLGGRWYYAAAEGEKSPPTTFDFRNADHLLYHDDRYSAPFAGMMNSVLRAGEIDSSGVTASHDQAVEDNVVVRFAGDELVIHSRGLPNHPTGKFPELGRGRGFNPNFIIEQDETFFLPLNPTVSPRHFITDNRNTNHALPMGPIGIALNGIAFFNPFDMGNQDATDLMDRCCGHPNQDGLYHYHKYPICMNSPWSDPGSGHSALIGFAFDGFPIYGPYESAGVMAKDVTGVHALNGFNLHYDADRGWHYHVTPGKFPYILGGYWGKEDPRDDQRPQHPRGAMTVGGMMGNAPPPPPDF